MKDGSNLLSRELGCTVLLDTVWLAMRQVEIIRPLKCVHDQIGKALHIPSQITSVVVGRSSLSVVVVGHKLDPNSGRLRIE